LARAGTKLKEQAEYLSRQYHCVVTNPDLMATLYGALINQHSWMFLSTYLELRPLLIDNFQIEKLHKYATPRAGMITGNNEKFVRFWWEVSQSMLMTDAKSRTDANNSNKIWFPYQKGGSFRKWFGNKDYVVNWQNDGNLLRTTKNENGKVPAHAFNEEYIFRANVNWSAVASGNFSARITKFGSLFDAGGSSAFPENSDHVYPIAAYLNSTLVRELLQIINPTLNFQAIL
jgi:hypothetical protein